MSLNLAESGCPTCCALMRDPGSAISGFTTCQNRGRAWKTSATSGAWFLNGFGELAQSDFGASVSPMAFRDAELYAIL